MGLCRGDVLELLPEWMERWNYRPPRPCDTARSWTWIYHCVFDICIQLYRMCLSLYLIVTNAAISAPGVYQWFCFECVAWPKDWSRKGVLILGHSILGRSSSNLPTDCCDRSSLHGAILRYRMPAAAVPCGEPLKNDRIALFVYWLMCRCALHSSLQASASLYRMRKRTH